MMDYYKILGIPENADQKEIKRAYFRLVRQHSPEKDPERFQQIREAYEILTKADGEKENKKKGIRLEFPVHPLADQMRIRIEQQIRAGNYKDVAATAEQGIIRFGEIEGFLYFLAQAQRYLGNSGKAVKNMERLVELFPDKILYRQELAAAYMERGYGKKAYQAYQEAYARGCRDTEFLNLFALCCRDREKYDQGVALLMELAEQIGTKRKENIEELLNAFQGMFFMGLPGQEAQYRQIMEKFFDFLQSVSPYMSEYREELMGILMSINMRREKGQLPDTELFRKIIEKARSSFGKAKGRIKAEMEDFFRYLEISLEQDAIEKDGRLSELMKRGYEVYMLCGDEPQLSRFMQRDMELCMLEQWPGIKTEFQIIWESYPLYYEKIRGFVQTLEETSDLDRLRDRLLKDYERWVKYIDGGFYYEEYPERRKNQAAVQWDSDAEGTYVRNQPKIGRNDPCPCGSGKKYKNCCGRN